MEITGSAGFRQCKRNSKGPNAGRDYIYPMLANQMFDSPAKFSANLVGP